MSDDKTFQPPQDAETEKKPIEQEQSKGVGAWGDLAGYPEYQKTED